MLNILRPARVAPNVSAHTYMHGRYDFNAHPLTPLGMEVEIHLKPGARETWEEHSALGWNSGTSFEHHRCYDVYINKSHGIRPGNTIFFEHKYLTLQSTTPGDAFLLKAAVELKDTIEKNVSKTSEIEEALKTLMSIFQNQSGSGVRPHETNERRHA